jgi:DNA polymerase-1
MEYAVRELGMKAWTEDQAQAFINKFLRSYPQLDAWIAKMHKKVPAQGYVESPFGRRRRFPLVTARELSSIQRQAVNTPIQSAASDICLSAMVVIDQQTREKGIDATVLFPVHDSICIEVAEADIEKLRALCKHVMEKPFMGCPLTVDFEVGPTWADTH